MIDPTRLADDRQTTLFELELLQAAQQDVLVPSQRTRMLGGLGVIGFTQAPSGATGQLASGSRATSPLATGSSNAGGLTAAGKQLTSAGAGVGGLGGLLGKALSAKGLLGATLLGTVALVTVAQVSESPRPVVAAALVETPALLETPAVAAAEQQPVVQAVDQAQPSDAPTRAAPRQDSARQDSSEKSTLARELALIETARAALAENRPRVTLSRLDTYRTQFPHGRLGTEASMLRLEALVAVGDRAGAQRIGTRLLRHAPNSPYSPRIRSLLGDSVLPAKSE